MTRRQSIVRFEAKSKNTDDKRYFYLTSCQTDTISRKKEAKLESTPVSEASKGDLTGSPDSPGGRRQSYRKLVKKLDGRLAELKSLLKKDSRSVKT